MHPSTWKSFERRIAKKFGGVRRGCVVSGGTRGSGLNDIKGADDQPFPFSIECKYSIQPSYGKCLAAARQAAASALPGQMPIGVVGKQNEPIGDAIVVMRLQDFLDWHVCGE